MASTELQICNVALARIGVRDFISSLSEQTTEGLACNALYATTRDTLLAALPWPFATKHATLALLSGSGGSEDERGDWEYVYAFPSDCLVARHIWTGVRNPSNDGRIEFVIELNAAGNGAVILTDREDAELVYTAKVTNPLLFPPLFVDCLEWKLAAELSMALATRPDYRLQAQQMAQALETRAGAIAFTEQHEAAPTTPSIASRD